VAGDIVVYVEHDGGKPRRYSLEAASRAAKVASGMGRKALAVVLGAGANASAETLGRFGVDEVYADENAAFDQYLAEPHVAALAALVSSISPSALLFPDNADGKDIASRLSARLSAGAVANVVGVEEHDSHVDARETIFGGSYVTTVEVDQSPLSIFLVRPNAFPAEEQPKPAALHALDFEPTAEVQRAHRGERVQEEGAPTPLEEATIIVSGGRGLGGPEPFDLLEALAKEVGGVVGASRAAVDAGWISYAHQVGQTGRTVKPQLYIAVGISGAVQHRVGMQTADTIVTINKDPDAPITQLADLAVVGDLFQIVPALTEEIKKRKSE
jgi:electron transfer flavoprotein alpha subunit